MKFLIEYIKKYKITYISTIIMFFVGIILAFVLFANLSIEDKQEVNNYISSSVSSCKENGIDNFKLFKSSILENIKFTGILYLLGCTIIAGLVVYIAILYKGFLIGYTGFSIMMTYGITQGIKYLFPLLILHNIIYLPALFLLATSGIRMYKEIMKKRIDVKVELLKHSIIMLICVTFSIVASGIEAYISPMFFEIL